MKTPLPDDELPPVCDPDAMGAAMIVGVCLVAGTVLTVGTVIYRLILGA